jgi:hypothetical protein
MILCPQRAETKAAGARNVPNGKANCRFFFRRTMKKTPTTAPTNEPRTSVSRVLQMPR